MKAETAYNVINVLAPRELKRLFDMLEVESKVKIEPVKKTKSIVINKAEITDYILKTLINQKKRRIEKESKKSFDTSSEIY